MFSTILKVIGAAALVELFVDAAEEMTKEDTLAVRKGNRIIKLPYAKETNWKSFIKEINKLNFHEQKKLKNELEFEMWKLEKRMPFYNQFPEEKKFYKKMLEIWKYKIELLK